MGAEVCINTTIVNDQAFEKNETFSVQLSSEPNVDIVEPCVNVLIIDEEGQYS